MSRIKKASEIYRKQGTLTLIRRSAAYFTPNIFVEIYRRKIWKRLPSMAQYGTYNGVMVTGSNPPWVSSSNLEIKHRMFDGIVPWNTPSYIPEYKQVNVDLIKENYESGDEIIIVGGGNGVTAVHAAKIVGTEGKVTIFEADQDRIRGLEMTLKQNGVDDICEINHTIVGKAQNVDSIGEANILPPSALPQCDILEMDCEGAEFDIIRKMESLPEKIIVELHQSLSNSPYSSEKEIFIELSSLNYSVERYDGLWAGDGVLLAELN